MVTKRRCLRRCIGVGAVVCGALLAATAGTAQSKETRITGKVASGFKVAAVLKSGEAVFAVPKNGRFAIKTNRARGPIRLDLYKNESYFGPVVFDHAGQKALVALKGGANVGSIKAADGYASASGVSRKKLAGSERVTADRSGRPIGSGTLGFLGATGLSRSAGVAAAGEPSIDHDGDGITDFADVDDDNNGTVGPADMSSGDTADLVFSDLQVPVDQSVNAATADPASLAAFVRDRLALVFYFDSSGAGPGGSVPTAVDVDCAVVWCAGSTISGLSETPATTPLGSPWLSHDANGNGRGYDLDEIRPGVFGQGVMPGTAPGEIVAGQLIPIVAGGSGTSATFPQTVPAIPLDGLAITGFGDGSSSYAPGSGMGNESSPLPLSTGVLTFELIPPNRATLPGESGAYAALRGMRYGATVGGADASRETFCPGSSFGSLAGGLTAGGGTTNEYAPLQDTGTTTTPGAERLTGTLDLNACAAANGTSFAGQDTRVTITAFGQDRRSGMDRIGTWVVVRP